MTSKVRGMINTKHQIEIVSVDERRLVVRIDGTEVSAGWQELSPRLAKAPDTVRRTIDISPGGYGLHWPLADEDLSIDGILRQFG